MLVCSRPHRVLSSLLWVARVSLTWAAPSSVVTDGLPGSTQAKWSRHLSKLPMCQGTVQSPRQFRGRRGKAPSLETLGCFRDDVPKTQLHRVSLEILIGVEKLEKVTQGQDPHLQVSPQPV